MRLGSARPQYDYSVSNDAPLHWDTIVEYAVAAERAGYDSLWLSDHLCLDLAIRRAVRALRHLRSAGHAGRACACRLTTTAPRPLVMCEAFRPGVGVGEGAGRRSTASASGRLDVGIGAGWYEPDYTLIGMAMPAAVGAAGPPLREAIEVCRGMLGGGPFTFDGRLPPRVRPRTIRPWCSSRTPPIIVGGKGDRVCSRSLPSWPTAGTPAGYGRRGLPGTARGGRARLRSDDRDPQP